VLGYNPERQFALLTRLGMEIITWQKMAFTLLGAVALVVGLLALLMLRRLTLRNADAVQAAWLKFCRKLARKGIVRSAHEGPQDFAARAAKIRPQLAPAIADITASYVMLRYDHSADSDALNALRRKIRAFKL
jgi:hypothetical protein